MDMLDSLMHDDRAGLHAVTGDRGESLIRDRIGDRRRVDNHSCWFFGNSGQVDTCPDCHQVSCRWAARNENEIAGTGSGKRCIGGMRGGVQDGETGSAVLCGGQYGCQASGGCACNDRGLRFAQVTPLCG